MKQSEFYDRIDKFLPLLVVPVGTVYTAIVVAAFVTGPDDKWLFVLFAWLAAIALYYSVDAYILIRQSALPAGLIIAFYNYYQEQTTEFFLVAGFIASVMITIGLVEAKVTTGKHSDFWRSFLYHPLSWEKYMGVRTNDGRH